MEKFESEGTLKHLASPLQRRGRRKEIQTFNFESLDFFFLIPLQKGVRGGFIRKSWRRLPFQFCNNGKTQLLLPEPDILMINTVKRPGC